MNKENTKKTKRAVKDTKVMIIKNILRMEALIRDKHKCQKCGAESRLELSHVLTKRAYPNLKYDLNNVKILCHSCHIGWWHVKHNEAMEWFKEKFPERWEYLQSVKNNHGLKLDDTYDIYIGNDIAEYYGNLLNIEKEKTPEEMVEAIVKENKVKEI